MRGQNFTPVATHIQAGRKNAGAMGTIESAQKRTKDDFNKVFLEDSEIKKIEKLITKINIIILNYKMRYPKEFSSWENTGDESYITAILILESLLKSGIITKEEDILTIKQFRNKISELKKIIIVEKIKKDCKNSFKNRSPQEFDSILNLLKEAKKAGIKENDIIMYTNNTLSDIEFLVNFFLSPFLKKQNSEGT